MTGVEAAEDLPPPVRYTVEPGDLAAVRTRQLAAMRRDMAPILSNVIPLFVGLAFAAGVYLAFRSLIAKPIPTLALLLVGLSVFGVSTGGLAQAGISRWSAARALSRFDRRVAGSAAGGEATATLDDDGLTIETAAGVSTRSAYGAMTAIESDMAGLFVAIGQDFILHVPRRAFESDPAMAAWVEAIRRRLAVSGAGSRSQASV